MLFEDIFKEIGDFGRGQKIQYFLLCWPFMMAGFLSVDVVFLMAVPDFVCRPDNITMPYLETAFNTTSVNEITEKLIAIQIASGNYKKSQCFRWSDSFNFTLSNISWIESNVTSGEKCRNGFWYSKKDYGSTIPNEFGLVCEYEYVRSNLKTVFFVGRIFGAIVFGQLSDLIGRLFTFLIVVIFNLIAGVGLYFSVSPVMVGVFLLVQGFTQVGYTLTTFVLGTELVGTSKRKWAGTIIQLFYTTAFVTIPFAYYLMQSWRYLALFSGLPSLIFFAYYFCLYESPRWLLAKGETYQVMALLEKVAKTNNVKLSERMKTSILEHNESEEHRNEIRKKYFILDLIRTKSIRSLSLNVWFNWIVNALVYYGIIYNTENLPGSLYLNFVWMGLVEVPACCICMLLLDRVGRKRLMIVSLWATGLACFIAGWIPKKHSLIISTVAMTGKFFVSISYGVMYFFTAELFPTVVRNSAMGMASLSARFGGVLAVQILSLQYVWPPIPMIIFAVLAGLAGGFAVLIPETKGKPLDRLVYLDKKASIADDEKPCLLNERV